MMAPPVAPAEPAAQPGRGHSVLLIAILVIGLICGVSAFWLALRQETGFTTGRPFKSGTLSVSLIGAAGLQQLLVLRGEPVRVSQFRTYESLAEGEILALVEPTMDEDPRLIDFFNAGLGTTAPKLVVLPRFTGQRHPENARWIRNVEDSVILAQRALREIGPIGRLTRLDRQTRWFTDLPVEAGLPSLPPNSRHGWQLLEGSDLEPLLQTRDGLLLAGLDRSGPAPMLVITDPTLLNNAGLGQGRNARLVLALIQRLREESGASRAIVFDETIHGLIQRPPHPLSFMIAWPGVLVTAGAALLALLLVWYAAMRFGAPVAEQSRQEIGRVPLIRRGAELLAARRDPAEILGLYLDRILRRAAREAGRSDSQTAPLRALAEELDLAQRSRPGRGLQISAVDLVRRHGALGAGRGAALNQLAQDIHRFRQDRIHGRS